MARGKSGWHPEDIKAALRKRYGTLTALTDKWGVDRSLLPASIVRPTSHRIEALVAEALHVSPHALWPDRWTPEGVAIRRAPGRKPSRPVAAAESQKGEAA